MGPENKLKSLKIKHLNKRISRYNRQIYVGRRLEVSLYMFNLIYFFVFNTNTEFSSFNKICFPFSVAPSYHICKVTKMWHFMFQRLIQLLQLLSTSNWSQHPFCVYKTITHSRTLFYIPVLLPFFLPVHPFQICACAIATHWNRYQFFLLCATLKATLVC